MAGLATLVARLGELVGSLVAVLGNVAGLAARVALDGASLAVLGKVVRAATLVTRGVLAVESAAGSSWRSRGRGRVGLRALSGDVTKLRARVALGALGSVGAVALDVSNITTGVALLGSGGFWFWASTRLVAGLATVVAQSLGLLAVVGNVAGFSALVTGSWEHFWFSLVV